MRTENMTSTDYTIVMKKLVEDSNSQLKSFYCREDFIDALRRLKQANPDNRAFLRKDLERLCAARELGADAVLANSDLLCSVPTRDELLESLLEILHENYSRFYSSTDYMTRIVRRLVPEYREDPVRTAILKMFIRGAGFAWKDGKRVGRQYRTRAILKWAAERFTPEEAGVYEELPDEAKMFQVAEKLDDSIFSEDHMGIGLDEAELFFLIVGRLSAWAGALEVTENQKTAKNGEQGELFVDLPLRVETAAAIREFYTAQGIGLNPLDTVDKPGETDIRCAAQEIDIKPEDTDGKPAGINIDCLARMADALKMRNLTNSETNALIQPFFPLLQEDFEQYIKTVYYKNKKGKYQKLSALFKTNRRDERDKKLADWELLRLCDDYAGGKFRTNGGKTRVYLYYFAMVFGMTFYPEGYGIHNDRSAAGDRFSSENERSDPEKADNEALSRDLVKNLFEDYYSDNVIRFLSEEYSDGRAAAQYESEPAGDGINYKNYAEIIYLYYLCHRELYETPGEGIDRAECLISDCRKAALAVKKSRVGNFTADDGEAVDVSPSGTVKNQGVSSPDAGEGFTDYFREELFRQFLNLPEEELQDFILEHYRILSENSEGRAMTMVSSEENTAYENMELIMENLHDAYLSSITASRMLTAGKFEDAERKKAIRREIREADNVFFCWELPALLHEKYPQDTDFLRVIDNLDKRLSDPLKNISSEDKRITRSTFLSMCLSDYIPMFEDVENIDSFPALYRDFLETVNPQLEEARFQPFQEKNLMDLYVLLSLYFYVVKNGR